MFFVDDDVFFKKKTFRIVMKILILFNNFLFIYLWNFKIFGHRLCIEIREKKQNNIDIDVDHNDDITG